MWPSGRPNGFTLGRPRAQELPPLGGSSQLEALTPRVPAHDLSPLSARSSARRIRGIAADVQSCDSLPPLTSGVSIGASARGATSVPGCNDNGTIGAGGVTPSSGSRPPGRAGRQQHAVQAPLAFELGSTGPMPQSLARRRTRLTRAPGARLTPLDLASFESVQPLQQSDARARAPMLRPRCPWADPVNSVSGHFASQCPQRMDASVEHAAVHDTECLTNPAPATVEESHALLAQSDGGARAFMLRPRCPWAEPVGDAEVNSDSGNFASQCPQGTDACVEQTTVHDTESLINPAPAMLEALVKADVWEDSAHADDVSSVISEGIVSVAGSYLDDDDFLEEIRGHRMAWMSGDSDAEESEALNIDANGQDHFSAVPEGNASSWDAVIESPTRAEAEKAFRSTWQQERGRGSSPTAAAAQALRHCRSSASKEASAQDNKSDKRATPQSRTPCFNDAKRLLQEQGSDFPADVPA
eukprot:CAMPEP_0117459826 /NCGR_PEP_ID=MMETSP0784-20121206/1683_1 /TAXON_ID=39447 /ORGANISM="" /LENGTH=470 /DNA_ID=CAMNT_0005253461 /DNA_START=60 /DNA_END=1472 /DNA_ORIENTATION=-